MFGSTFVLPHVDGNITCIKINQDKYSSEYLCRRTLDEVRVRIRHTTTKATATAPAKDRHNVEVVTKVYATATVPEFERKVYIVIEHLPNDLDVKQTDALSDWLIASANANVTSLLSWES